MTGPQHPGRPRPASSDRGTLPGSGAQPVQVARFLRETLEAYASPEVADAVLRAALKDARLEVLPAEAGRLSEFVEDRLLPLLCRRFGEETAEEVRQRLGMLLVVVSQTERAAPEAHARPALDPDATPTLAVAGIPYPVVIVVGPDADLATELTRRADVRTQVIAAASGSALLRHLRQVEGKERLVMIDLRRVHGLLDPLRAQPELVAGALVLLWGASREQEADLRTAFLRANVMRCAPGATLDDIAAITRLGPKR